MIKANDLLRQFSLHADEYEKKAIEVLRSGWYILGKECEAYEQEWAEYIGAKHCVGVASGLDALQIALRLLGIGKDDEVIVSANAYIACVISITMNGAIPIFVDSDQYGNIDASKIEDAITPRTKAILAVHLYGQASDMTKIMAIGEKYQLKVVEDCAQSHGNHWQGKKVGTWGDVGCFSFYPTKGCGAFGDAGCIVTDDADLAKKCRIYRNYGSDKKYHNIIAGCNSRLDELQAGFLRIKLKYLDDLNRERVKIAERYIEGICNPLVRLPLVRPGADSTWHQFVIRSQKRNELRDFLQKNQIDTMIHYPIPPHLSDAYKYLGKRRGDYPEAEHWSDEVLSLPMYNGMTSEEQETVIHCVNAFDM